MNSEINDKLDVLIALVAKDCGNDDVEMFKNLDTSNVSLSKRFYARQRRAINRYERKPAITILKKFLIRAAIALMMLMSIGFMTVMALPGVRSAVFEAVVEWYENYVAVHFEPYDTYSYESDIKISEPEVTDESLESNVENVFLTEIETVKKPTYLPEGAEEDLVNNGKSSLIIDYYIGEDTIATFSQTLYSNEASFYDNKSSALYEISMNGYNALVFEFELGDRAILWIDGVYYYSIYSTVLDVNELIKIALSVG